MNDKYALENPEALADQASQWGLDTNGNPASEADEKNE
jgi:hypothetical protein